MTDLQSLPWIDEFETSYRNGRGSFFFPAPLEINVRPRATKSNSDEWKAKIREEVRKKLANWWPPVQEHNRTIYGGEYHFYMVFKLLDKVDPTAGGINRYRRIDVDNLLKATLDAVKDKDDEGTAKKEPIGLISDDVLIKGIKAYKEPVYTPDDEGLLFQCMTTNTFTIKKVEMIDGNKLRSHWTSQMQCITAVDEQDVEGKFIDNLPGRIFIARTGKEDEPYPDAVPGFDWEAQRTLEPKATGCMVFERTHSDRDGKSAPKTFHWIQKWSWW